jgi:hypothetical protein
VAQGATRIGFFSKMREVVALLVVSLWQDLFEILTFASRE